MQKRISTWLTFFVLFAFGPWSVAQDKPKSSETKVQAASKDQENNIKEYIELLRSDVRRDKAQIMGAMMQLTAEEAAKFWPIYNEYDAALTKLNNMRLANIQDYARSYDQLSDAKADELIQNAIQYQQQRLELLAKYYGTLSRRWGPLKPGVLFRSKTSC